MDEAMNTPDCPGEKRSDVAIQLYDHPAKRYS